MGLLRGFKQLLSISVPQPAVIDRIVEEEPPPGTTCNWPTPEAWNKAIAESRPGKGIREEDLEKCGKPAIVRETVHFKNGPKTKTRDYCESCRPRTRPP